MREQTLAMAKVIFKRFSKRFNETGELAPSQYLIDDIKNWLKKYDEILWETEKTYIKNILSTFENWTPV